MGVSFFQGALFFGRLTGRKQGTAPGGFPILRHTRTEHVEASRPGAEQSDLEVRGQGPEGWEGGQGGQSA